VALVRTDVTDERIAFIIRVKRSELGTALTVTINRSTIRIYTFTLMMEAMRSSETSVLARATRRHIPKGGILLTNFVLSDAHCIVACQMFLPYRNMHHVRFVCVFVAAVKFKL
jgi:hypothetical protein